MYYGIYAQAIYTVYRAGGEKYINPAVERVHVFASLEREKREAQGGAARVQLHGGIFGRIDCIFGQLG